MTCPACSGIYRLAESCLADLWPNTATWGSEPQFTVTDWCEGDWWAEEGHELVDGHLVPLERCPVCFVAIGGFHHLWCTQAWCVSCDGQALGCPHEDSYGGVEELG